MEEVAVVEGLGVGLEDLFRQEEGAGDPRSPALPGLEELLLGDLPGLGVVEEVAPFQPGKVPLDPEGDPEGEGLDELKLLFPHAPGDVQGEEDHRLGVGDGLSPRGLVAQVLPLGDEEGVFGAVLPALQGPLQALLEGAAHVAEPPRPLAGDGGVAQGLLRDLPLPLGP